MPPTDTQIGGGLYPSACVHGFGYDDENDDYVLLRLIQTFEEPIESVVSIYSLRANEWRQLQEIPYYLVSTRKMMGVFCARPSALVNETRAGAKLGKSVGGF